MKTPAVRVLKARIQAKADEACAKANDENERNRHKYEAEEKANQKALFTKLKAAFIGNVDAYVRVESDYHEQFKLSVTSEWTKVKDEITKAHPVCKNERNKPVRVGLASLDMSFYVPASDVQKWKSFGTKIDRAFLDDDAKAILTIIEQFA